MTPFAFRFARAAGAALALGALLAAGCATPPSPTPNLVLLQQEVTAAERAFARSMAVRDHAAFTALLADDTVFFTGPKPYRGKAQVAAGWKRFYERPDAPFSWEPAQVEVLDAGNLALSTGPVRDPKGKLTGTFTSVWRREAPGVWRIIFDKGDTACDCPKGTQ